MKWPRVTVRQLMITIAILALGLGAISWIAEMRARSAAYRRRGCVGGRKRRMTPGKVESARKLLKGGMAPRDVALNLGVSVPTLYRWVPAASLYPPQFQSTSLRRPSEAQGGPRP